MIEPPIDKLIKKAPCRYALVAGLAKRAREYSSLLKITIRIQRRITSRQQLALGLSSLIKPFVQLLISLIHTE